MTRIGEAGSGRRRRTTVLDDTKPRCDESGVALIMTLMLITLLVMLVVDLAYETRVSLRLVTNHRDSDRMYYALRGEVEKGMALLRFDKSENSNDSTQDEWAQSSLSDSYDDINVTLTIEDESRRFNLLWLLEPDAEKKQKDKKKQKRKNIDPETGADKTTTGKPDEDAKKKRDRAFEMLVTLIDEFRQGTEGDLSGGEAREIARSIREFINRGANGSSASVARPATRDGAPITVDQLLLCEGITEEFLHDTIDPRSEELLPGLANFVTIWSEGLVNVNTAPEIVLRCLLDEKSREKAHDIVSFRQAEPQDDEGKKDLEKKKRLDRRKQRERRERDERRLGRSLSRGRDEFEEEDEDNPWRTPMANQVFEELADLGENNLLDAPTLKALQPWISVSTDVFSIFATAVRGNEEERIRVVVKRGEDGSVIPILWEKRHDPRLNAGEKTRDERRQEALENGEEIFGGGGKDLFD